MLNHATMDAAALRCWAMELELMDGLEPTASRLQGGCSTN